MTKTERARAQWRNFLLLRTFTVARDRRRGVARDAVHT